MNQKKPLQIGFISRWDVQDASALSGMPAAAWQALSRQGLKLIHLDTGQPGRKRRKFLQECRRRTAALVNANGLGLCSRWTALGKRLHAPFEHHRLVAAASAQSRRVSHLARTNKLDALFGICISTDLFDIDTTLPVVYATDATARLVNTTYPEFRSRAQAYHTACDLVERAALGRVDAALFASRCALESAINDYGFPAEGAYLAPLGATVVPRTPIVIEELSCPARDDLELLVVASDPARKRLDFCIDIAEELNRRGLRVQLHYVGPYTSRARRTKLVQCAGRLSLSEPTHRNKHGELLRRCHFLLLPSQGEMYGIAPCEAAHFGRPSLVSDVGGLPTVVLHNRTGFVFPKGSRPNLYANEIEALCDDAQRYRELCKQALKRARSVLNWDVWGRTAASVIRELVDQKENASKGSLTCQLK